MSRFIGLFKIIKTLFLHIYVVIYFAFLHKAFCVDFYREKPFFVESCKYSEPNFNKCFVKSIRNAFHQIIIGIPGVLETNGPIDPFFADKMAFNETNDLLSLEGEFTNMSVTGLSNSTFTDYRINATNLMSYARILIPFARFDAKYRLNGRVLLLPFNSTGEMYLLATNFELRIRSNHHLYKKDGYIFMNATHLELSVDAGKMHTHYDSIFPNQEVNEIFNDLINDNWKKLFDTVRPLIEDALAPLYLDVYQTIFDLIPITFFIEDITTNSKLYENNKKN